MSVKFIQATQNDKSYLLELRMDTMTHHLEVAGVFLTREEHAFRLNEFYECFHIIHYGGQRVGAIKYQITDDSVNLFQLQISSAFQGCGIGGLAMKKLITLASCAVLPVKLTVLRDNPAKYLYERLGFEYQGEDELEYHMVLAPVDSKTS